MTSTRATVLRRFNRNRLHKMALMNEAVQLKHIVSDSRQRLVVLKPLIVEAGEQLKADARDLGVVDARGRFRPGWRKAGGK